VSADPFDLLAGWLDEARATPLAEPTAAVLATVGADGRPSARVVLLRNMDPRGLDFYTNLTSRKARDLLARPVAALCLCWEPLDRQVRIEGHVTRVPDDEADRYWATRPRESQLGAWASRQSAPLASRDELDQRFVAIGRRFEGAPVPRPPFWSGFRLAPDRFEFWRRGAHRLHHREEYVLVDGGWRSGLLHP
jgi:pyridoxamine 5'-phosphate oxidase